MRVTPTMLVGRGRRPLLGIPPFKELMPLRLKERVAGKGGGGKTPSCLQEMAVLFACLSTNEFREPACSREVAAFQSCYAADIAAKIESKQQRLTGGLEPNQQKLSRDQLNLLLSRFPPKHNPPSKA